MVNDGFTERGIDPAPTIVLLIDGLQKIVSRNVSSADRLAVSIAQIHMVTSDTIVADDAWLSGTVRNLARGAPEPLIAYRWQFGIVDLMGWDNPAFNFDDRSVSYGSAYSVSPVENHVT